MLESSRARSGQLRWEGPVLRPTCRERWQRCAGCHFNAGSDTRPKNQLNLLAPTKYRTLELVGDYLADALQSGKFVVRLLNLSEEQILRPEKCRACPLNE